MAFKKICILSAVMIIPYLFFRFVLVNLYPHFTLPIALLLILVLPLVIYGKSGFWYGMLTGAIFTSVLSIYTVIFNFEMLLHGTNYLKFIGFIIVTPITAGIVGKGLSVTNKRVFPLFVLISLIIHWAA